MAQTTPEDSKIDLSTKDSTRRVDRMLDDAIEDSFSTSDPIALTMPHNRVETSTLRAVATAPSTLFLLGGGLLLLLAVIALRR